MVCDDLRTLEWCANLATLPLHIPAARVAWMGKADWAVTDFDPKGAPFEHVITLANALHARCERAGLPNYVKTSGQSGLHVLIPLGGQCTFDQAHTLAYLIGLIIEQRHPTMATTNRNPAARGGRVDLDCLSKFCV